MVFSNAKPVLLHQEAMTLLQGITIQVVTMGFTSFTASEGPGEACHGHRVNPMIHFDVDIFPSLQAITSTCLGKHRHAWALALLFF
jgi:hypothetical protein